MCRGPKRLQVPEVWHFSGENLVRRFVVRLAWGIRFLVYTAWVSASPQKLNGKPESNNELRADPVTVRLNLSAVPFVS